MAAHYVTLTPALAPFAYLSFALEWITCILCIVLSIRFYLQRRGQWWMIAAIAFAAPLLVDVFSKAAMGLPPLPYGVAQVQKTARGPVTYIQVSTSWDFIPPIMALGLVVAALEGRPRKSAPTVQSEKTPAPSE